MPQSAIPQFRETLRQLMPVLAEDYQVASLGLFGSYVREQQRPDSDLDVLVTFQDAPGLLKFMELEAYLSEHLGVRVDLVMKDALRRRIGEEILREVVPV